MSSELTAAAVAAFHRPLRIVIVGHVDHGKSTLIGRLLNDTDTLPEGKVAAVEEMSRRRGMPFEWSFVLDALQAERDQGITIDTTQIGFRTARRGYVIIDAPGHTEFLKNMVTGAAGAEAAVLVIDAGEGALEQSRRHAYLLHLLGVRQVAVAVNKLDLLGFDERRFEHTKAEIENYLADIGIVPSAVVPIAARHGDNIAGRSANMPWYVGPTIVEALDNFTVPVPDSDQPLRLPIQDVYKPDDRRILAGRVESGRFKVGDTLYFAPGGRSATVVGIEAWNIDTPWTSAVAGQSVGLTLDRRIFVERGDIAYHAETPPDESHLLQLRVFWLTERPLEVGRGYTLKVATAEHRVVVESIDRVIDVDTLTAREAATVARNEVADVVVRSRSLSAIDRAVFLPRTGRGVLLDEFDVVGGAIVLDTRQDKPADIKAGNIHAPTSAVSTGDRVRANGHRGGILWMTGLSGSGKSTLSAALERTLFERGRQVVVLDGDRLRLGINSDLGFSPEDRSENIRRVAEVARLFADTGLIVITALISPTLADRARARAIGGRGFQEIFIKADLTVCEARDPKGLYAKARRGEIADFTGISAPYEAPVDPELVVDTGTLTREDALDLLLGYVEENFGINTDWENEGSGV